MDKNNKVIQYLKITNIKGEHGEITYHGLDVNSPNSVVPGSPLYSEDYNTCYMMYNASDYYVPDSFDIRSIDEQEYLDFKEFLDSQKPVIGQEERIKQLENMVETLLLSNGGL